MCSFATGVVLSQALSMGKAEANMYVHVPVCTYMYIMHNYLYVITICTYVYIKNMFTPPVMFQYHR